MNNRFLNYILALLLLTFLSYKASAQNIQAEAKLQQYTIRIGDQTKLFLTVHQPAKEHVNFPKLTDTITGKIQVVGANKPDTSYDQNDHSLLTVTQSYTITCFDAGTYTMPSFSIGTAGGVIKTNELTLQVETVKVDTTKAIYDIKQPITVSYTFLDWLKDNWYWIVLPLLIVGLVLGLIWYLRSRPKAEPLAGAPRLVVPPHVTALNQLKQLKDKKLWQQEEVKQYYIELSDIIREYLEKRYAIKTHEKTTDEIFDSLKRIIITDTNRSKLRHILVLADLVKFAKEKPLPAENEESIEIAVDFVVATKQQERPATEGGNQHV
ncbi:BatD family protein [uncultured Mucilaginibacter sp.]|uniref:BatD family protein n=1 Tax=uncultured Mucilaginibacter sp. TaxID=797541 RepID=UPI0025DAD3BA|nr:BatD family protein [uncultured Mucilaginibacter sp.]